MVHLQNAVIKRELMTFTDSYYQTLTSAEEEILPSAHLRFSSWGPII